MSTMRYTMTNKLRECANTDCGLAVACVTFPIVVEMKSIKNCQNVNFNLIIQIQLSSLTSLGMLCHSFVFSLSIGVQCSVFPSPMLITSTALHLGLTPMITNRAVGDNPAN